MAYHDRHRTDDPEPGSLEDRKLMEEVISDYFAFAAAAKGPEVDDVDARTPTDYTFTNDAYYDLTLDLRCAHGEQGSEDCVECNRDGRW